MKKIENGSETLICATTDELAAAFAAWEQNFRDEPDTCHVTIEPVYEEELEIVRSIAHGHGFRVADLLMRKRLSDTPERSQFDTFCTSRSKRYDELYARMDALVTTLIDQGYDVWRYKIEDTLIDVRTHALKPVVVTITADASSAIKALHHVEAQLRESMARHSPGAVRSDTWGS